MTSLDENVTLYDLRTGAAVVLPAAHSIMDVDFSRDGKLVAAAGLAGEISVWNMSSRELVTTMSDAGRLIFTLRFSPDSTTLASGDNAGNVIFWDARSGLALGRPLNGHGGSVGSARSAQAETHSRRSASTAGSGSGTSRRGD